jgi:hypothetical protein
MLDRFHTVWCSAAAQPTLASAPSSPPQAPPGGRGTSGRVGVGFGVVSAADDGWIRLADIAIMLPLVVVLDRSGKAAAVIYRSISLESVNGWRGASIPSFLFIYTRES